MQAFEDLLEHLRAANCGEAPPRLPDDPARLAALHREALHFALPGRRAVPSSCLLGPSLALPRLRILTVSPGWESVQLFMQSSGTHCSPASESCGKAGSVVQGRTSAVCWCRYRRKGGRGPTGALGVAGGGQGG